MAKRDSVPLQVQDLIDEIRDHLETNDVEGIRNLVDDMEALQEWLNLDSFNRLTVNRRLKQYSANDEAWMWWQKGAGDEDQNTSSH